MILTCPKCATSYTIDDAHLGAAGRNVRCQACRATWFATRPEEPIELVTEAETPPAPPREVKAKELPRLYRQLMEDKKRLKAISQQAMIWGGMTVAFVAILLVTYVLRVDIVRAFPSAAKAFASVDPNVETQVVGVVIPKGKQTMTPSLKGGRFVITLTTDVSNITDQIKPVPPIQVHLMDAHGKALGTTLIVLKDMMINPKSTRSISFDVPDPKNMIANVAFNFDLMAMKEMKEKSRYDKYYKAAAKRAENGGGHGDATADHGAPAEAAGHGAGAEGHGAAPELKSEIGAEDSHASPESHEAPALKSTVSEHH